MALSRRLRYSKAIISFTDECYLNDFYAIASRHKAAAHGVKSLHINFRFHISAIGVIRALFALLANLEDLELSLDCLSRVAWMRILGSVQLQTLSTLSTNAPHDVLVHFLCKSPNISHVSLTASCRIESVCPLEGSALPLLASVRAPASCVSAIVHGNPVERVVVIDSANPDVHSFRSMIAGFTSTIGSITSLHLEFNPVHWDVLRRLAAVVPNLGALKLVEKLDTAQVCLDAMSRRYPQQC